MRGTGFVSALLTLFAASVALAQPPQAIELADGSFEADGVEIAAAEEVFAESDAAVYFPDLQRVRWRRPAADPELADLAGTFVAGVERDYPGFRDDVQGAYVLKVPMARPAAITSSKEVVAPQSTIFTESFESGMGNWTLEDNTLELYKWGATTCEAHSGSRSADALRGGVNNLGCNDPYAPGITTSMTHKSCEGIAGASQAWVDVWIHVESENGKDSVGFYYDDRAGDGWGYGFSGTWTAWFHVVLNLKQWYRVGDVTATSCPKLTVQFRSDAQTQPGIGARIDDLTVGTGSPSFLAASISASPSSGAAPLTVNFTGSVSNGSSPGYLWWFGDAGGTIATTKNASFTYQTPGDYSVRFRASQSGVNAYAHTTIHVTGGATHTSRRRAFRHSGDVILATKTIGTAGGTLSGGGFTLTVPAGAFGGSTELSLARRRGPALNLGEVSDRFVVSGLPATIAKELTLQVPLSASALPPAAGEKYYLSVDAPAFAHSRAYDEADAMKPFLQVAGVSGATLTGRISTNWGTIAQGSVSGGVVADDAHAPYASEIQAEKFVTVETTHFYSSVRSSASASTRPILDMLETQYARIENMGFSLACRVDSSTQAFRKIEVVPKAFGTSGDLGGHQSAGSPCGTGWVFNDYLEITTSYPPTSNDVSWTAAHELFHLVQDIYSPGGARANLWLKEASSTWLELVLGNTCPTVQSAHQQFPWNGLFNSEGSAVEAFWTSDREMRHGYGASYAFLHRARSLTDPFVQVLWNSIRSGSSELAAFQTALGSQTTADFWASFSKEYFTRGIAGACQVSWAGGSVAFDRASITSASSLPATLKFSMYPLGARSWAIDLQKYTGGAVIQPATLGASGLTDNQSVYVIDVQTGKQLGELTKAAPSYSFTDLGASKGKVIVAIAVDRNAPAGNPNAQDPANAVTLTLAPAVSAFGVSLWEVEGCGDIWQGGTWGLFFAKWNGNAFSYTETENTTESSGKTREYQETITGTLSSDRKTLTSFVYENHWKEVYPNNGATCRVAACVVEGWRRIRLTFVGAAADWKPEVMHFLLLGPEGRSAIAEWYHREAQSNWSDAGENYDCTYAIDETKPEKVKVEVMLQ